MKLIRLYRRTNAAVIATPANVASPDLIFSSSPPFFPEVLVPVPVTPAPDAVAVPLPPGEALLAVLFVDVFPEEGAGRPCTLILVHVAARSTALFPGV